jgi:hypothetical protein
MLSHPTRIETTITSSTRLTQRVDVLPSRAPLPRPRTIHDRTLVVRRAHGRAGAWSWPPSRAARRARLSRGLTALLTSDQAFAGGLLLAWGLTGTLAHLWLAPLAPLA